MKDKIELAEINRQANVPTESAGFFQDVLRGLQASQKFLESKYFYDAAGDKLFQEIMDMEEYYLTGCEMEIFTESTAALAQVITAGDTAFDLIELGAGDATKTRHLLSYLLKNNASFTYFPIDISANIIDYLTLTLPVSLPGLDIQGLKGDYFDQLKIAAGRSERPKVVLFLGSNIGNMSIFEASMFCLELRRHLVPGDRLVIGADLKKNPHAILAAYNDRQGITKRFNLNLLERINRELSANFNVGNFDHFASYDPITGACKSFLVSLGAQTVHIQGNAIHFQENELIDMEISQKYSPADIGQLAMVAGFQGIAAFYDRRHFFTDVVWSAT